MDDYPIFVRLHLQSPLPLIVPPRSLSLSSPTESISISGTTTTSHIHRRLPLQSTAKFAVLTTSADTAMDTTMDTSTIASSNLSSHPVRGNDKAPLVISTSTSSNSSGLFPSMTASNLMSPSSFSPTMMLSYDVFSLFQLGAAGAVSHRTPTMQTAVWKETTKWNGVDDDDDELEELVRIQHPQLGTKDSTVASTNGDERKDDIQREKSNMIALTAPTTTSSFSSHTVLPPPARPHAVATTTLRNETNVPPRVVPTDDIVHNPNHLFDESLLHTLDQYQTIQSGTTMTSNIPVTRPSSFLISIHSTDFNTKHDSDCSPRSFTTNISVTAQNISQNQAMVHLDMISTFITGPFITATASEPIDIGSTTSIVTQSTKSSQQQMPPPTTPSAVAELTKAKVVNTNTVSVKVSPPSTTPNDCTLVTPTIVTAEFAVKVDDQVLVGSTQSPVAVVTERFTDGDTYHHYQHRIRSGTIMEQSSSTFVSPLWIPIPKSNGGDKPDEAETEAGKPIFPATTTFQGSSKIDGTILSALDMISTRIILKNTNRTSIFDDPTHERNSSLPQIEQSPPPLLSKHNNHHDNTGTNPLDSVLDTTVTMESQIEPQEEPLVQNMIGSVVALEDAPHNYHEHDRPMNTHITTMMDESHQSPLLNIKLPNQTMLTTTKEHHHTYGPTFAATVSKAKFLENKMVQYDIVSLSSSIQKLLETSQVRDVDGCHDNMIVMTDKNVNTSNDLPTIQNDLNDIGLQQNGLSNEPHCCNTKVDVPIQILAEANGAKTEESSSSAAAAATVVVMDEINDWVVLDESNWRDINDHNEVANVIMPLSVNDEETLVLEREMTAPPTTEDETTTKTRHVAIEVLTTAEEEVQLEIEKYIGDWNGPIIECGDSTKQLNAPVTTDGSKNAEEEVQLATEKHFGDLIGPNIECGDATKQLNAPITTDDSKINEEEVQLETEKHISDLNGPNIECGDATKQLDAPDGSKIAKEVIKQEKLIVEQPLPVLNPEPASLLLDTLNQFQMIQNGVQPFASSQQLTNPSTQHLIPIRSSNIANSHIKGTNTSPTFSATLTKSCSNHFVMKTDMISTSITTPFILSQQPANLPGATSAIPSGDVVAPPLVVQTTRPVVDNVASTVAVPSVDHKNRDTIGDEAEATTNEASNTLTMETDTINLSVSKMLDEQAPENVVHGADPSEKVNGMNVTDLEIQGANVEENCDDDEAVFVGDVVVDDFDPVEKEIEEVCIQPELNDSLIDSEKDVAATQSVMTGPNDTPNIGVTVTPANLVNEAETEQSDMRCELSVMNFVQHENGDKPEPARYDETHEREVISNTPGSYNEDISQGNELVEDTINHETVMATTVTDDIPGLTEVHEGVVHFKDAEVNSSECDIDASMILGEIKDVEKRARHTFLNDSVDISQDLPTSEMHHDNTGIFTLISECSLEVTRIAEMNDVSVTDCTDIVFLGNITEYEDVQESCGFRKAITGTEHMLPIPTMSVELSSPTCDETGEPDTTDYEQKANRDVDALTQQNTSMSASTSTASNDNVTTGTSSTKENYQAPTEFEQPLQKIIPSVITTVTERAKLGDTPKVVSYAEIAKASKQMSSIPRSAPNQKSVLIANSSIATASENSGGIAKESTKIAAKNLSNHSAGSSSRFVPSLGGVIEVTPVKRHKSEDFAGSRSMKTRREITASAVDPYVLVLTSSTLKIDGNEPVLSRQIKALSFMESNDIRYRVLDATDTLHQNECTGLHMLSRLSNVYPQFFHVDTSGIPAYCGTIDYIENMIEDGSFIQRFSDQCKVVNVNDMSEPRGEVRSGDVASTTLPLMRSKDEGKVQITASGSDSSSNTETNSSIGVSNTAEGFGKAAKPTAATNHGEKKKVIKERSKIGASADAMTSEAKPEEQVKSEITVYGATSFVAKHAFDYFMQVSLSLRGDRTITLAGRNETKLLQLQSILTEKMVNLTMLTKKPIGKCLFDVFVADSDDMAALMIMARRTHLVANFAGPYTKYGEHVLAACAKCGTDYIDITGEISWAGQMRQRYSEIAASSGARIISLCGFDSIPSDISIFGAVDALRRARRSNVEIEAGTCWHSNAGLANGGTIHSALGIPLKLRYCFSQPVPFLLDDPLVLTHPRTRFDPNSQSMKNRMAKVEWLNQLPSFDSILVLGASAPFFMAPINTKVVHATALALNYGSCFTYRERFLPLGVAPTRKMGMLSILPALMVQFGLFIVAAILMTPFIGKLLADWLAPPGSGAPDYACKAGFAHVYAEVSTKPDERGLVDKANCSINFEGDPGNWVTAQCVCESALALVLDKSKLPPRSKDGFGTPAELLGSVLLSRLQTTQVRPVKVKTHVRKDVPCHETVVFL